MHVLFLGEPDDGISVSSHHARALAATDVQTSFDDAGSEAGNSKKPDSRPDLIHLVTFEQKENSLLRRLVAARIAGTQIVRYWTGRDLVWAEHHPPTLEFARALSRMGAIQICRSTAIEQGLKQLGIKAATTPIISQNISSSAPPQAMPSTFTALSYLPPSRRAFHGGSILDALVPRLPAVRFLILGDAKDSLSEYPNVELFDSYTDCVRAIHRCTVVVDPRMDQGLSRIQLEALSHGRHVICGHELPHSFKAISVTDFVEALRTLRENPTYNLDGRSFVARDHERHSALRALRKELEDALEPGRLNLVIEGGVRGAAAAMQNLHILSQKAHAMPDPHQLPLDANSIRCLLHDMERPAQDATI